MNFLGAKPLPLALYQFEQNELVTVYLVLTVKYVNIDHIISEPGFMEILKMVQAFEVLLLRKRYTGEMFHVKINKKRKVCKRI